MDGERQKTGEQLSFPGKRRGEAPKVPGEGIEPSTAKREAESPASTEHLTFSCKQRGFCPSCSAKRAALWAEFVREQVIRPVPHRHLVFALPKILRPAFRHRRRLLPKLAL